MSSVALKQHVSELFGSKLEHLKCNERKITNLCAFCVVLNRLDFCVLVHYFGQSSPNLTDHFSINATICNQYSRENLLLNIEILENPEEEVSDIIQYGEYKWIRFPESFMADWEKWQDLTAVDCNNGPCNNGPRRKGSCVDLDANSKWIATCQKDYQLVSWYLTNKNPQ